MLLSDLEKERMSLQHDYARYLGVLALLNKTCLQVIKSKTQKNDTWSFNFRTGALT